MKENEMEMKGLSQTLGESVNTAYHGEDVKEHLLVNEVGQDGERGDVQSFLQVPYTVEFPGRVPHVYGMANSW